MVDECGVVDVEWVKDLYRKKNSWATAYIRGRFFAGIRTTSRCESLHAKLGRFVESRYRVLEFVTNFQRCIDFLHDNEDELEFRSCYGTPVLQTEFVELKKSGWSKFTQEMFWRFRESLRRCVRVRIFESKVTDQCHIYRIEKYRRPDMRWIVVWEPVTNNFRCTCMRMESFGLPCVHILAVCVKLDLCALPDSLVLRRWAKTAKLTIGSGEETTDHAATYRSRLGAFSQICKRLRPAEPMVTSGLVRQGIKDPVRVRTKGTGRCSQAAPSVGKKRRKCSTCGRLGHRRTRCPNAPSQASLRPRDDFVLNRMTQEVQGGEKAVRTKKRKIGCDPSIVHQRIFSDSTTCIGECS
ncbi:protein FAR1-RELATED SEQUENCE 5-like [Arachis ipaensis]|uniref:protein FAR1-RELATED SEQUENCE 5-like n=1 Tax=Arachis ipaensis TaxID=130454 RepID=UPI0007AF3577|nr:protein FAR1-RELATED SEQUENCE 5-like [Arachis ipaensis]XP_025661403.1 protein FAR1-RELATED SEQUENCE 5-like [Arachis hypogaea]